MTLEDLIKLADEGNVADFQDAVKAILDIKAGEALDAIVDGYEVQEESFDPDEDLDELDVAEDETDEDDDLTEEELQELADTITEEEFEELDELSQRTLAPYLQKAAFKLSDLDKKKKK